MRGDDSESPLLSIDLNDEGKIHTLLLISLYMHVCMNTPPTHTHMIKYSLGVLTHLFTYSFIYETGSHYITQSDLEIFL